MYHPHPHIGPESAETMFTSAYPSKHKLKLKFLPRDTLIKYWDMAVTNWLPQQHILGLPLFGDEKNITWALWSETKKWPTQTKPIAFLHRWRPLSEFQGHCNGKNKWWEETEKEEDMQERHSDFSTIVTGSAYGARLNEAWWRTSRCCSSTTHGGDVWSSDFP